VLLLLLAHNTENVETFDNHSPYSGSESAQVMEAASALCEEMLWILLHNCTLLFFLATNVVHRAAKKRRYQDQAEM
jgi:hypothetical protein